MSNTPPRYRQLRGRITGGIGDVEAFYAALRRYAEEEGWNVTFQEGPVGFGDKGPIQKITFGFTST